MKHSRLTPSRLPKRASDDKEIVYNILDEALFCTISYCLEGQPFSIPTGFVRHDDRIYIHGSVGSHFIRELEKGIPVCLSATLADGIVISKSAFNHSMNYRSVVLFSAAEVVERVEQKSKALEWLIEKMVPGSWDYLRPIKENEIMKTTILAFEIAEASAKIRTGFANCEEEDRSLPIWSGVIPVKTVRQVPLNDELSNTIALPSHLVK